MHQGLHLHMQRRGLAQLGRDRPVVGLSTSLIERGCRSSAHWPSRPLPAISSAGGGCAASIA
ncbi:hypothetical protein LP420_28745 [Massilia sp. B-10]|nr:hypothetical protein LP420_28745 [Massilia sp. B-10]